MDAIAEVNFDWHGVDLFELRTYAAQSRQGPLILQFASAGGRIIACMLETCRRHGQQVNVPDGLQRYSDASHRLVHRLLRRARHDNGSARPPE
jgi:hypothetical protein